jgi:hypothetical protein
MPSIQAHRGHGRDVRSGLGRVRPHRGLLVAVGYRRVPGVRGHPTRLPRSRRGHRQIFASRRANYVLGILLGNLAIGLSYGWWVDKHTRHHAHPNQEGKDPDIDFGALAFTSRQAGGRGRFAAFVYRYQAYFFFPLLLLEGISLHVDSMRALLGRASREPGRPCCS